MQVQKPQYQKQDALVFQQPGLTALVAVDQSRRLQGCRVQQYRIAQRGEHSAHLVQMVLHIEIFCPLILHAAQHEAVVQQVIRGFFQHVNGCHFLPPCGG